MLERLSTSLATKGMYIHKICVHSEKTTIWHFIVSYIFCSTSEIFVAYRLTAPATVFHFCQIWWCPYRYSTPRETVWQLTFYHLNNLSQCIITGTELPESSNRGHLVSHNLSTVKYIVQIQYRYRYLIYEYDLFS